MNWCGNQYFVAPDHPPCLWFCEACQYPCAFSTGKSDSRPLECVISLQSARRVLWIWSRFWEVQAMAHKECTRAVPWSGQRSSGEDHRAAWRSRYFMWKRSHPDSRYSWILNDPSAFGDALEGINSISRSGLDLWLICWWLIHGPWLSELFEHSPHL